MNLWYAFSLILGVLSLYLFSIETFSVAFMLTGLAPDKVKFQVASIFTGSGFTTSESELVTNDRKRRRIATACMYTGHIFSVIIMGLVFNVVLSIAQLKTEAGLPLIIFWITLGFFLFAVFLKIPPINRKLQRLLERITIKLSIRNRKTNIITVLDLYGKSAMVEVILNRIPEFAQEKSLFEMGLTKKYTINILSILRGSRYIEVSKDTMFKEGDRIVVFGFTKDIKEVFVNNGPKNSNTLIVSDGNRLSLINNYGTNVLMEVDVSEVPIELKGVKLKDSHLVDKYSVSIVVIKRNDEYIFADKDIIIAENDQLTLFGPYKSIKHLFMNNDQ